jgi:hypothetical protein
MSHVSAEKGLMPVSELEGYSDGRFKWEVSLPEFVPTSSIGINVHRIERLAQVGGVGHVLVDMKDGDSTSYQGGVDSVGVDGSATASMRVAKHAASLSNAEVSPFTNNNSPLISYAEYKWGNGHITINATELGNRINDKDSLRSPEPWSRLLNKAILHGLTQASREQLLGDVPIFSKFTFGLAVGFTFFINHFGINSELLPDALTSSILMQTTQAMLAGAHGDRLSDRRISLIPAYQVDRLMIVNGLAKVAKVVKPLK